MLVVEFGVDSPILLAALDDARGTTVVHEDIYGTDEGIVFLFWAEGGSLSAFHAGLAADPTVRDPVVLAEEQSRRLYRVTFTETGEEVATFPAWSDLDISFLSSQATHEGWEVRMRMPDRNALREYRELCEENGFTFRLQSVYEDVEATSPAEAGLTDAQQEALVAARELGYFEIPREASLADLAEHCGVSPQAMSERLRRGTTTLVDAVLLEQ